MVASSPLSRLLPPSPSPCPSVFLGEQSRSRPLLKARHVSITLARCSVQPASPLGSTEDYGATLPPPMSTPGSSRAMATGFTIMVLSVSAGMHSGAGGFGLLLCFTGVLAGSILVGGGVRVADHPAPIIPFAFGGARALAAFVRRNTAVVGLFMASCAVTVVSTEANPVLCFGMFVLLLLAVSLINIGVRGGCPELSL